MTGERRKLSSPHIFLHTDLKKYKDLLANLSKERHRLEKELSQKIDDETQVIYLTAITILLFDTRCPNENSVADPTFVWTIAVVCCGGWCVFCVRVVFVYVGVVHCAIGDTRRASCCLWWTEWLVTTETEKSRILLQNASFSRKSPRKKLRKKTRAKQYWWCACLYFYRFVFLSTRLSVNVR